MKSENGTIHDASGTIQSANRTMEAKRNEGFRPFKSIDELVEYIKQYRTIWYLAPMDMRPAKLEIRQYTVSHTNPKLSRMTVWHPETKSLVFHLVTHFDRFRLKLNA